ncbi:TPA: hypothetical protein HA270_01995 [Candidatus Woesearchaeota archaeon]|nr:hypothetical protein [Candidatus Woesearchaeota archaeon]
MDAGSAVGITAAWLNLILAVILVIMVVRLLRTKSNTLFISPWQWLLFSLAVFFIEEVVAIMDLVGTFDAPKIFFPIFEIVIISSFLYMLLLQIQFMRMQQN